MLALGLRQVRSHAVVLLDADGVIRHWLAGAERIFGYPADEAVGRSISILFVPEDLALGVDTWERDTARRTGDSEDDRWQLRKDGVRVWVTGSMTALTGADGEPLGYVKIMRARTDQKGQVDALERRLRALQQGERQRIQFMSTLAHELRNPLGTVGNAATLLDRAAGGAPEVRFASSVIRRQLDFMTRMIDDLLELTRSAVGKVQLRREPIVLQELLARSVEACRAAIEQRAHLVQKLFPEGPIRVDGDPVRLQQVFVNLIENAAKYTPPRGNVRIKLTTEGREAVVHVEDDGMGISADLMPHVFELFTQGDPEGGGRGLGIGLALVKESVELHGGTVQATSDGAGKGSEFSVRLPMLAA